MKKVNYWQFLRQQKRKERRRLVRLNKNIVYRFEDKPIYKEVKHKLIHDNKILSKFTFELDTFLNEKGNPINFEVTRKIKIHNTFSLEHNYSDSVILLSSLRKALMDYSGEDVLLDFSDCSKVDFSALFMLKVLLEEYLTALRKFQERLQIKKIHPKVLIRKSKTDNVNKKLVANEILKPIKMINESENDLIPMFTTSLIKGSKAQDLYSENRKGLAITKIRSLINQGLSSHNYILSETGVGHLDGLISEILNNAEDHSQFNTWYAYGNLFETKKKDDNTDIVGEINLAVLNFGYSIFEGFESTKVANYETYNDMESLYNEVMKNNSGKTAFTKEQMFTLYSLQEGFSRLKYSERSRGTGTIKFIRSFFNLGDYEDTSRNFVPHLLIYSGNTLIKCDSNYKPFDIENVYYLSLNSENDMSKLPAKSHLCALENRFPGTFLVAKIYLNENHLNKKIKNEQ